MFKRKIVRLIAVILPTFLFRLGQQNGNRIKYPLLNPLKKSNHKNPPGKNLLGQKSHRQNLGGGIFPGGFYPGTQKNVLDRYLSVKFMAFTSRGNFRENS